MTVEQTFALANPDGGLYMPGAFVLALGSLKAQDRVVEAFKTGAGIGWHEHDADVFVGCEQFFRPGYVANLVPSWIPALDGVEAQLRAGARVPMSDAASAASTVLLAREYPESEFVGSDYHEGSIELARKRAADAGVADRVSFEVASAQTFTGTGYDLVATFDCLHDMGDPVGAAKHIRQSLGRRRHVADRRTGGSRRRWPAISTRSAGSTTTSPRSSACPTRCRRPAGIALGAQAGEAAIRRIATDAGFTRFRRATETPFNLVFEARP